MESVNVLFAEYIVGRIRPEHLQEITNISPRIKLTDASDLLIAERKGDFSSKEKFDALLADTEVVYARALCPNFIARAPKVKWVQAMSAGINHFLTAEMVESPVILTNVRGVHAIPLSEFIFEQMLMFVKQAPLGFRLQQEKQWKQFTPTVLHSKTVGILGLGSIGSEVARLAKAFGMRVLAMDPERRGRAKYVDIMVSLEQLPRLLAESDFVVLTLPLTPETNKLIGEKEFQTMKPTSYLINTARGGIVDEEVLTRALEEHWIAGAGLDVFAVEPLPIDSKLWELPNVIVNPHISGNMEDNATQVTKLFAENLRRYLNGEKLLHVIDKKKGY